MNSIYFSLEIRLFSVIFRYFYIIVLIEYLQFRNLSMILIFIPYQDGLLMIPNIIE